MAQSPRTIYTSKVTAKDLASTDPSGKLVFVYGKGDTPGKDKPRHDYPCEVITAIKKSPPSKSLLVVEYRTTISGHSESLRLTDDKFDFYEILNRNADDYRYKDEAWKHAEYY